jgi:hypothetical protein
VIILLVEGKTPMNWPTAFFLSATFLFGFSFIFLLVIYLKEYVREERLLRQFSEVKDDLLGNPPVYVMTTMPKKQTPIIKEKISAPKSIEDKNKKNIN